MTAARRTFITAIALVCGCLWAAFLIRTHVSGAASVLDRAETVLLDLRILINGRRVAPSDVVIVAIDDETVAKAGEYPIRPQLLASMIDRIRDAGAKALAVDMLLLGGAGQTEEPSLVAALHSLPSVIAAAGQFPSGAEQPSIVPEPERVLAPLPGYAAAAKVGLVNVVMDAAGTPRHIPLVFRTATGPEPSFGLQALGLYLGEPPSLTGEGIRIGDRLQPVDLGWHEALNYYGPAGTVRTVSAQGLLDGSSPGLGGRLVLLGVTATGVGDRFNTPFDPILPGVEVLATGLSNLLDGSSLVRDDFVRRIDAMAALLTTVAGILAMLLVPLAPGTVAYLLILCGWFAVAAISYGHGYWLSAVLPAAASVPPVIAAAIVRQVVERYEVRKLIRARQELSRFQSPKLARRIAEDPAFLIEPKEQDVAILFVDLAGYTGLSERLGPARTREVLKAFHTLVVNETARHGGLVLDFMGDGAMICFGLPDTSPEDGLHACRCAIGFVSAVRDWLAASGLAPDISEVRIGGHFGPAVLSRLGHDNHQQIAATGDCINVASRLMEVGKLHQASVVLSVALLTAAYGTDRSLWPAAQIKTVPIRGRQKDIDVALWTSAEAIAPNPA